MLFPWLVHAVPSGPYLLPSLEVPILPCLSTLIKTLISNGPYLTNLVPLSSHHTPIACFITFHLGIAAWLFYVLSIECLCASLDFKCIKAKALFSSSSSV